MLYHDIIVYNFAVQYYTVMLKYDFRRLRMLWSICALQHPLQALETKPHGGMGRPGFRVRKLGLCRGLEG